MRNRITLKWSDNGEIMSFDHDTHGRSGMEGAAVLVKRLANALAIEIEEI